MIEFIIILFAIILGVTALSLFALFAYFWFSTAKFFKDLENDGFYD